MTFSRSGCWLLRLARTETRPSQRGRASIGRTEDSDGTRRKDACYGFKEEDDEWRKLKNLVIQMFGILMRIIRNSGPQQHKKACH